MLSLQGVFLLAFESKLIYKLAEIKSNIEETKGLEGTFSEHAMSNKIRGEDEDGEGCWNLRKSQKRW